MVFYIVCLEGSRVLADSRSWRRDVSNNVMKS